MDVPRPTTPRAEIPTGDEAEARFHTRAWGLWLLAAFTPAVLTKNPWYLLLTLAAVGLVWGRLAAGPGTAGPEVAGWGALLRLGLVLAVFAALFPPLFVKAGETHLLTLPGVRFELPFGGTPPPAMEIGGRVSLESVVYGLATGAALVAILLTFAAFSAGADPYQMLRGIPRFLHRSGVVLSIALTFVPQTLAAQREIREAQALRGHRFRGLRDLAPLFVRLLTEALERSLALAEALEARGFGGGPEDVPGEGRTTWHPDPTGREGAVRTEHREPPRAREARSSTARNGTLPTRRRAPRGIGGLFAGRGTIAAALGLLLAGALLRSALPHRRWGDGLLALGLLGLAAALWALGRRVRRSRYRRQRWRRRDTAVTAAAAVSLALLAGCWVAGRGGLNFYPYPRLETPLFDPLVALALALLAVPAIAVGSGWHPASSDNEGEP